MGMTIDELVTFCEEEGYNHRQRTELYNEVQKAIQKHIDDLSGKDNKGN